MFEYFNINEFDQFYEILEKSFPDTEVRPKNGQKSLFSNKEYKICGIRENGIIAGIAAIWEFDGFTFIEHLATDPEKRNNKIGSRILSYIINESKGFVCLEVEPPVDELTRRRVGFYQRNGFHFNEYPYIQPSIAEGRPAIPLFIMSSPSEIDEPTYNMIKAKIYQKVYNVKATD